MKCHLSKHLFYASKNQAMGSHYHRYNVTFYSFARVSVNMSKVIILENPLPLTPNKTYYLYVDI